MKCEKCGIHEGVHGFTHTWCQCCILKAQIKYAKERAAVIPQLEEELRKCKCK